MKPVLVCRCGHVERSHKGGPCTSCGCREFASAIPVFLTLPAGVVYVRTYSTGLSLVECSHACEHQRPTGGWAAVPTSAIVGIARDPIWLDNELSEREARARMRELPGGYALDYGGVLMCEICKGDEFTTRSFELTVKQLAVVPEGARCATATLF